VTINEIIHRPDLDRVHLNVTLNEIIHRRDLDRFLLNILIEVIHVLDLAPPNITTNIINLVVVNNFVPKELKEE
jgi:hypothetical protein